MASNWWADAIKNPSFDNGDPFTSIFATLLTADMDKPSNDKVEKFKKYLADEIRKGIIENPNYFTLSVDYDPDEHLSKAASKAHLDTSVASFPWKTTMFVTRDKVSVRAGYGAAEEVLYDANQSSMSDDGENIKKI